MIQRFDIINVHMTADDKLQRYIMKKLGNLDRYLPRNSRDSAHAEVRLKESDKLKNDGRKNPSTCEVTLHLPHEVINVSESTVNMYAAVDIIEQKLKQQILKYKETHATGALRRRLAARFARKPLAPATPSAEA